MIFLRRGVPFPGSWPGSEWSSHWEVLGYALTVHKLDPDGNTAMPKIDIAAVPERKGSGYPPPFDAPCAERVRQRLGDAGGLTISASI